MLAENTDKLNLSEVHTSQIQLNESIEVIVWLAQAVTLPSGQLCGGLLFKGIINPPPRQILNSKILRYHPVAVGCSLLLHFASSPARLFNRVL